ncbi:MAG: GTP-binding protein [Bacteroidales bacterium]|nr:GTP-binding protein [Bacteroidales bacterium]
MCNSNEHNDIELLRFTTAGSVDDGKSTLIGRLLYDSKLIFEDQFESIKRASLKRGEHEVNLALLTDGLRAEREQGITIDVAYRYFSTPNRKFIIADTPGHIQYTRNMVTGASTANLAIVLVDARKGILEQTKRHAFIASLLKIPHLILCINKMDLVDYSQAIFKQIKNDFTDFSAKLEIHDIRFIPVSALHGDNVVDASTLMPWYKGPTLLYLLENIHIGSDHNLIDCRFPIQYVIRPESHEHHDYRGYAGMVAGGVFKTGDEVMILPSKLKTTIKTMEKAGEKVEKAFPPMSVSITLSDDIDISRGDMIVRENNSPDISQNIEVMLCWMNEKLLKNGGTYIIKHTTKEVKCIVKEIRYKIDINTLHRIESDKNIGLNEFARIFIKTAKPLFFDKYKLNRITGSLIFIDPSTNETLGAGMII